MPRSSLSISEPAFFAPIVPQPRSKPLLDYKIVDHLKTIAGMAGNPIKTLSTYQFQLPVFQYQIFGNHFTVVNDPAMIRHCFVENAQNYHLEPIRQAILTPVLRNGLVATEGEKWREARKVLAPLFTPKFTRGFADQMKAAVEDSLHDALNHSDVVPVSKHMSGFAYQVLSETLFSGEIKSDAANMMSDVADFFQFMGNVDPLDMLGLPAWIPRPTRLRGGGAVRRLRKRIRTLTQDRIKRRAAKTILPDDLLTRLIIALDSDAKNLCLDDVEDHILTFIAAGHETTARGLSWMLYLLAHDPAARARVENEIDALDSEAIAPADWQKYLTYTVACFEETMRLYPPAPFITRRAIGDDSFGLAFVPAGSNLFLNLYALHRHEQLWEVPNRFMPDRFLGQARKDIQKFQYLPFGVGQRTCIGGHFAMQEALIILTCVLKSYRFEYAGNTPPCPVMRITLKPDNGIPMRIIRR